MKKMEPLEDDLDTPPPPYSILSKVSATISNFHNEVVLPFIRNIRGESEESFNKLLYSSISILILVSAIGSYIFFTGSSSQSSSCSSCPFKETVPVSQTDGIIRCTQQKSINCLQAKHGYLLKDSNLKGFYTIQSILKPNSASAIPITLEDNIQDFEESAKIINNFHNNLIKGRMTSGYKWHKRVQILDSEYQSISNTLPDNRNILKNASFVSIKTISHSDDQDLKCVLDNEKHIISQKLNSFKMRMLPFRQEVYEHKVQVINMEKCTKFNCFHDLSEVIVIPMGNPGECGCGKYSDWSQWMCDLPFMKGCNSLRSGRCSLTFRKISWNSTYTKEETEGEDSLCSISNHCAECPLGQNTNALMSVLLCH